MSFEVQRYRQSHYASRFRRCADRNLCAESFARPNALPGQDVFFRRNLPLRWVRIAGIVVAIDNFPHRRIYTIDDSDGLCIECVADLPKAEPHDPTGVTAPTVDVGAVVDVKGGLALFRGNKQIRIEKMTVLRSTNEEVALWEKARQFRGDVLDRPWKLTDREIRKCRKEAERQD